MNVLLWIIQILLAALFLFAGVLKLVLPLDRLTGPVAVPGLFLRFIGLCETLGGLGLILPGLLRIRTGLTPLAAAGLVIIMVGATVLNLRTGDLVTTTLTIVVGLLAALVAYARWKVVPLRGSSTDSALRSTTS
ncbi:MAG TPA: DoxX family protein [Methylomirabilota bacterium]|nr:DoxX family protein [Methylomirabilota bacterium]